MAIAQPIVGYRGWAINEETGWLMPPHRNQTVLGELGTPWRPRGLATARCNSPSLSTTKPPAHEHCGCGLYGHFEFKDALYKEGTVHRVNVLGAFVGFGACALHETGFRAGKARIIALTHTSEERASKEERAQIKHVAELYEVPFLSNRRELRKEAARWGKHLKSKPPAKEPHTSLTAVLYQARIPVRVTHQPLQPLRFVRNLGPEVRLGYERCHVQLELRPGTQVRVNRNFERDEESWEVEGIDGSIWGLLKGGIEQRPEEVPYEYVAPGSTHLSTSPIHIRPGPPRITMEIVADLPREDVNEAIRTLQNVGHLIKVELSRGGWGYR